MKGVIAETCSLVAISTKGEVINCETDSKIQEALKDGYTFTERGPFRVKLERRRIIKGEDND